MDGKLYQDVLRAINTYWIGQLKGTDLAVLIFIVNRTVRYNKPREVIPIRHFTEGVIGNGGYIQMPVQVTRPTLIAAYHRLEARGLIRLRQKRINKLMVANEFEVSCKRILRGYSAMSKLKVPRRLKNFTDPSKETLPAPVKKFDPKVAEGKYQNRSSGITGDSAGSVKTAVTEAKRRVRVKQEAKASTIDKRISMKGVVAYWKQSMLRAHPRAGVPNFTQSDYGKFKAVYGSVMLPIPLSEFIDWAIDNWAEIKQRKLAWANQMPDSPDLYWFGSLMSYFVKAYADLQVRRDHHTQPVASKSGNSSNAEAARLKRELEQERAARKLAEKQRDQVNRGKNKPERSKRWVGEDLGEEPDEWT